MKSARKDACREARCVAITRVWAACVVFVVIGAYILFEIRVADDPSAWVLSYVKLKQSAQLQIVDELEPTENDFSSLHGPYITTNFADPNILHHDGTTYAFATNNKGNGKKQANVQVAILNNDGTWTVQSRLDALPAVALWQTGQAVWAPDIKHLPNGGFILYYTDSLLAQPNTHCLGAALSDQVTGPYDPLPQPLVCPHGGAIDPAGFFDRTTGKRYVVYKIDGNSLGHGGACSNDVSPIVSTPLMLQEVNPLDGITLIGKPVKLLDRDAVDGPLIEAPAMYLSSEGIYFLFYSSDCFSTAKYHTRYATATNITGPYIKAARPLFTTGDALGFVGPGGMDIIHHSYDTIGVSHTIDEDKHGHNNDGRMIVFHGHMTVRNDPTQKQAAQEQSRKLQKPITDVQLPLVRGMYAGTAYFKGRKVTFKTGGFDGEETDDSGSSAISEASSRMLSGSTPEKSWALLGLLFICSWTIAL